MVNCQSQVAASFAGCILEFVVKGGGSRARFGADPAECFIEATVGHHTSRMLHAVLFSLASS